MEFNNNQQGNGGYITLSNDTEEIGRLTYTIFPEKEKLVISFVLVHRQYEGQGMGKKLVLEGIEFARNNHWKVYPHCSYARAIMMRLPNMEEVFLR
jgi:predicted GNAT family acetyltransferase